MAGSFSGGGCFSDAPPFARLALNMEKRGRLFWKIKKRLADTLPDAALGVLSDAAPECDAGRAGCALRRGVEAWSVWF